jgi:hypothetical protein
LTTDIFLNYIDKNYILIKLVFSLYTEAFLKIVSKLLSRAIPT